MGKTIDPLQQACHDAYLGHVKLNQDIVLGF